MCIRDRRQRRRLLLFQLFDGARLRPDRAGGRVRARLPADRRGAGLRRAAAAEEDPPDGDDHPMTWPVKDADLGKLGRAIVKEAKGLVTGASVARPLASLTI